LSAILLGFAERFPTSGNDRIKNIFVPMQSIE
jgi:hypothetical protein